MKHVAKRYILYLGHMYAPGDVITTADTDYLQKLVENEVAEIIDDEGKPIVMAKEADTIEEEKPEEAEEPENNEGEKKTPEKNKPIGRKPR